MDQWVGSTQLQIDKNLGSAPPAGPGPPADRRPVLVQRRRLGLLLSSVLFSAAAVTVAASLSLLVLAIACSKHRYAPLLVSGGVAAGVMLWLWCILRCAHLEEQLLVLLGVLLSSTSVLLSGLDGALLSSKTLGLLCSVSSIS